MSDIDFDELDRAVNSLISNTPKSDATTPPAAPAPDAIPVSAPSPASEPSQVTISQPSMPQSLAGQRSSGRFMDVIHPSADMRSSIVTTNPVSNPTQPNPIATGTMISDFNRTNTVPEPQPTVVPVPTPVTEASTPVVADANAPKPLESPFISGAKVEKRPLGTFSDEPPAPTVELTPSGEVEEKPADAPAVESSEQMNSVLPEELQGDLLKIESGNSEADITTAAPVPDEAPAFESDPTGPTSIVQQYKEQPAATDQKTGPIYDTNVYHKPLAPEGKKKSGWMWIVWIILLLAVGIGAGAITYFYVLPLIG